MMYKKVFWNIALSGKLFENNEKIGTNGLFIRYILMNLMFITGFCALSFFSIEAFLQNSYSDLVLTASMFFLCFIAFLIARTTVMPELPILMVLLGYPVFCVGLILTGADQGAAFVWIYMYPLMAILLMGMRFGVPLSLLMIIPVSVIIFIRGSSAYGSEFAADSHALRALRVLRAVIAYFSVMGIAAVLEIIRSAREKANPELIRRLKNQRDEIEELKAKVDAASEAKSSFLANMSHEIRTPMNAVIGMTELLLRQDLPQESKEHLAIIKQSGNNLLSIINDVLDFSKTESGEFEFIEKEYLFASLINDVINIIRVRLGEKPLRFVTMIDGKLPARLYGDEVRTRQVILNLLTNAIKYTSEGSITFSVRGEKIEKPPEYSGRDEYKLHFEVRDTGIGIKAEDMENLFGNFVQFDRKQKRSTEGMGLSLALSRNLCRLMGGDLTAESVYGEGSVFTAVIPQKVSDGQAFALVENAEKKNCLVYEKRKTYAMSITYTLKSLGAPYKLVHEKEDLIRELKSGRYQFAFIAWPVAEEIQTALKENACAVTIVAMAEYGKKIPRGCRELYMPTQPVMVAHILNGENRSVGFQNTEFLMVPFTAPDARILVVDDIACNIDVVTGLLAPYQMTIDQALSGIEALKMVKKFSYDMILMDHMMPGMDGIETTEAIRAWERAECQKNGLPPEEMPGIPIVALTANAICTMKERFLEKGFTGYVSKPIEIAQLDEAMARLIPVEKQIKAGAAIVREILKDAVGLVIPGVDVVRGINMTGGTEAGYRKVLAQFYKDAEERLSVFAELPGEGDLPLFTTHAHALRSAAGTIGAAAVSKEAAVMEAAGKARDTVLIAEKLPAFYEQLSRLIEGIGKILEKKGAELTVNHGTEKTVSTLRSDPPLSPRPFHVRLSALKEALERKDIKKIDRLLEELEKNPLDAKIREDLDAVSDKVLMGDYQDAVEAVAEMMSLAPELILRENAS